MTPVPAPAEFLSLRTPGFQIADVIPHEGALVISRTVWYETLSRAWAKLRGDL
jgi:hypothetical protein